MKKKKICLIGQPNVGKSSIFNILTGMHQHTGNWTGKTVTLTTGDFLYKDMDIEVVDLPGTYSLIGVSSEEKISNSFIVNDKYDVAVVILNACNLERGLALLLQVLEVTNKVIVCLNLLDVAKKKGIVIDIDKLEEILKLKVIFTSAKYSEGIEKLKEEIYRFKSCDGLSFSLSSRIERYISFVSPLLNDFTNKRRVAINLLMDESICLENQELMRKVRFFRRIIKKSDVLDCYISEAKKIGDLVINRDKLVSLKGQERLDKLLTNKLTGIPIMIILLFIVLTITISFSNKPSDLLFTMFSHLEWLLYSVLSFLPDFIFQPLVFGGYRTLYWVVSVMLPPMAIFFPLFSLLEDYGILPRIAFNLDKPFRKCGTCGKQSLTMCMGLGCNAVGVTGARIMEDKKTRILSIITNAFMPCNGRFPAIISVISMFFVQTSSLKGTFWASFILTLVILMGIVISLVVTKIGYKLLFKEEKTVFVLEMPEYRKPKILKTIFYALKNKAFNVLLRAMKVAFPAGLLIYFLANVNIFDVSLLHYLKDLCEPFGMMLGLDGAIILAFLLGIPANEIVIPILLLCYSKGSSLVSYDSIISLKQVLVSHGWTMLTGVNFIIFSLCHFPCATTLMTIKEETGSKFYTLLSLIVPTVVGISLCFLVNFIFK